MSFSNFRHNVRTYGGMVYGRADSRHASSGYFLGPVADTPYGPRHATTILCVRKGTQICIIGDGQVSQGSVVVKPNAKKVRRLSDNVVAGFAGATADCLTLVDRLEGKLEEYPGQLLRACVELAKSWRLDRYLRHLEATMIVADERGVALQVTGNGDVLEGHDGILGIGSGGNYAIAAARALIDVEGLSAPEICEKAMKIAADMCVMTNHSFIVETIDIKEEAEKEDGDESEEEGETDSGGTPRGSAASKSEPKEESDGKGEKCDSAPSQSPPLPAKDSEKNASRGKSKGSGSGEETSEDSDSSSDSDEPIPSKNKQKGRQSLS
uniref:Uncharacterized protein n=1 Tax=Chromera velia CCMP2878 TaxID=1169474 RepID=A0A0G4GXZ1_9ALVE|eukprot:Cvel_5362.t1-p1 / transcript=Cvel_5362.t1 / gene=Cvel_5362 / organism=Chromera_velia_CCMP2878 / gene_product=ATP-dependent protease subunit HslV, putative / transcript_product=ATP-dependent protease subunit HslV, putative / location=Cvel_scaffold249:32306-36362(-) / protein_length=323 / sequence_SO=supercontig / SO=protein_coding / is_pseudo=false